MARKTVTSTEVKQRWENANYNRYAVRLRKDVDRDIILYIENRKEHGDQTTEIFREALELLYKTSDEKARARLKDVKHERVYK